MIIRIGLENNVEGRSLAWALEHPGCFAYGSNGDEAMANLPRSVQDYAQWIALHGGQPGFEPQEVEIRHEETWDCFWVDEAFERARDGYEINAWFLYDWKPLTAPEIQRGLQLLAWSRGDLIQSVEGLSEDVLSNKPDGERWSISRILGHVGGAEWWYLHRLGLAFPQDLVPKDPFQRLEAVRSHVQAVLPGLAGSRQVVGIDAEFWSPRKLLRRAVWHELDHVGHIRRLRSQVE